LAYPQIVDPAPATTTAPPTTQPPAPVTIPVTAAPVAVAPVTTVAPVAPTVPAPALIKPATITGTVFLDKNKNKLQDPKDPGLSGVQILLTDPLGVTTTVITNEDGAYTFENLEAGAYVVTVVSKKAPNDGPKIRKINVEAGSVSSSNFSFISSSDVLGVQENGAGELAFTGSNSMTLFLTAIGFAGLGVALTSVGRRRRNKA
jgi:SdrD B-like domain